jgi:hypothetical protein
LREELKKHCTKLIQGQVGHSDDRHAKRVANSYLYCAIVLSIGGKCL